MDPQLYEAMYQSITVIPYVGAYDPDGNPILDRDNEYELRAQIDRRVRLVRTIEGEEVVSTNTIFVEVTDIHPASRIRLPTGNEVAILQVAPIVGERVDDHTEIMTE